MQSSVLTTKCSFPHSEAWSGLLTQQMAKSYGKTAQTQSRTKVPAGANTPYGISTVANQVVLTPDAFITMGGHPVQSAIIQRRKHIRLEHNQWTPTLASTPFSPLQTAVKEFSLYSYLVVTNAYDNQLYCYGQGPSKTTVNAPNLGVTTKTPVTITGSVTDISGGTQQDAVSKNFPNGLPAVSNTNQTQYMEELFTCNNQCQQTLPVFQLQSALLTQTATTVRSAALQPTQSGNYGFNWTPDIAGSYTLTATFTGSGSYFGSSASTYFYASGSGSNRSSCSTAERAPNRNVTLPQQPSE